MPNNHPGAVLARMNPSGKRKFWPLYGRQELEANTPFAIETGMHQIEAVLVTAEGAAPVATAYTIAGNVVSIESAAAGTVSYLILGY